MKLLHCLNSPHIGGIERLVIELAIEQKEQGIDVSIMLDTRKGQYYEYLQKQNIPLLESGIKGGFDFSFTTYRSLKKQFSKFDVVHLHSFSPLRSLAAKKFNTVYTIHGLSKGIRKESFIKYLLRETIKKYSLRKMKLLIANSNYTQELATQHYGLEGKKFVVVMNGVHLPQQTIIREVQGNRDFTIGLVSRFTERKRIDRLINGFNCFLNKGGKGRLVLVGDGATFGEIKQLVKKKHIESYVELIGYSNRVQDFYINFDICVFPSEQEPFGLVGVEAYNNGKPVLAFQDSGGLKEVVEPLEPDNIIENESQLADRMLYYFNNLGEIEKHAEKRRIYARENFSVERMEREYMLIYRNLL